jgi:chromosome segregation protein
MITRIVMQGFKSFNKRISVPLLPGFNVICGPNGVGKSNVLDAIAFVLGRTSAKSLRADKLHELIYSGAGSVAQYAAVTMYLDNSTKIFPFEESEISVTRKVNKRGVSIYKLNGKTTTREKIVDILAASRIYSDGHNIVLQGDITDVIEMMPEERRTIVDEISGIADYNDKKQKAQRDLDAVDAKLKEAEIVISERYDLYKKLEEERNSAIKYQQLQKQMSILKASLAYRKLSNFQENFKAMDDEITKKEVENEELFKEIEKIESELEKREKGIRELASKLTNMAKRVEVEKEISYLRTKIMIDKDKIESNKKEIERIENLIQRLNSLESRMQEFGDFPRAVKAILDLKMKGVHGTIRNLIKVPEKYQIAVEVTAANHLNDIVVDNDSVASEGIDFLKRERIGRATFLPLNKIKARDFDAKELLKQKGVIDVVTKILKFDVKFSSAIDFVFGSTLLVENLSSARALGIGKARMVTLDGDLVERSGAMIGGFYAHQPKFAKEMGKDEIGEYQNLKKKLEEEIKTMQEEIHSFEAKLKEYSQAEETREFVDLSKTKIDTEEELEKIRSRRKIAYEKRLQVQTDLNRLKIQKAKVEAELENVKIDVGQYGQMEYLNQGIKTLETGIANAMKDLAALGAVNFKAIEQYENFKTEFDEYKKKYEKILEEKKAVMGMIAQIEEKRKEMFYKAMVDLSTKFDEIFFKMTGGHASVTLEDAQNLESGLMIQATPAGKNLLNIDSMSGGEKSITALAFLFAVQAYRPAPFYILDEIDAALDKENSKKVSILIKSLSQEAQFIVISHNDLIIKSGDRIYGCTMEKSESKIIALELPKE